MSSPVTVLKRDFENGFSVLRIRYSWRCPVFPAITQLSGALFFKNLHHQSLQWAPPLLNRSDTPHFSTVEWWASSHLCQAESESPGLARGHVLSTSRLVRIWSLSWPPVPLFGHLICWGNTACATWQLEKEMSYHEATCSFSFVIFSNDDCAHSCLLLKGDSFLSWPHLNVIVGPCTGWWLTGMCCPAA